MKPPGILPKNTQTWVIAGLATVMVAAIALSGNGSKSKAPAPTPRQAAVTDPNASRIAEYRNRLEEETRKLAAEQATLNQAKQAAAGSDPRVAAAMQTGGSPNTYAIQQPPPPDDRLSAKKQLEAERERKEYNSLFASNVALTFRKDSQERHYRGSRGIADSTDRGISIFISSSANHPYHEGRGSPGRSRARSRPSSGAHSPGGKSGSLRSRAFSSKTRS
jgi:hypothetical protein